MARPQENHPVFTTPYSPITERENEGGADDYVGGGCGCFRRFCFGWEGVESSNYLLQERGGRGGGLHEESWVVARFKKLKELSELVAGPKWKNFVRRIGKICNPKKYNTQQNTQFQYSPESYALNFAGGDEEGRGEEDGNLLHSFSSRFAAYGGVTNANDQQRRAGL